jgi:hypothetical protein
VLHQLPRQWQLDKERIFQPESVWLSLRFRSAQSRSCPWRRGFSLLLQEWELIRNWEFQHVHGLQRLAYRVQVVE